MKVKVCPKCGSENKETNESCSSCYASIVDVELVESTKEPIVLPPAPPPKPAQPRAAQAAPRSAQEPPGPPPGPAGHAGYTPAYSERRAPTRRRSSAGLVVLVLILAAGGAVAAWWFFLRQPSPGEVLQRFFSACEARDTEKAKSFLSKSSLSIPGMAEGFSKGFSAARKTAQAHGKQEEAAIRVLATAYAGAESKTAIVTWEPRDKSDVPAGMDARFDWVLVKEEGGWKIDLLESSRRMMQKLFGEALKKGLKIPKGAPMGP